jgi:hypothetical protein
LPSAAPARDFRLPESFTGPRASEYPKGNGRSVESEQTYAGYTRALWDEQNDALRPLHTIWMQNLLFLASKQWFEQTSFRPEAVASWRERPVTNLCMPFFKTFLAKVTKVRPAWSVIPDSSDPDDIHSAQLAQQVLEAKWAELKLGRSLRRAIGWTIATGNGYLLPYWNTSTGRMRKLEVEMEVPIYEEVDGEKIQLGVGREVVPCDENGDPKLDPETGAVKRGAKPHVVDMGEIGVRVLSPFQVRVNPEAEDDSDVSWYIVGEVRTLREIQQSWPEVFERDTSPTVSAEDVGALSDYERAFSGVMSAGDTRTSSPRDTRDEELPKALVLFYFERPCADYPDGRYWVCTKDVLLEEPGPLPEGVWPGIVHLKDIDVPGRYHAASTLENVVELNREYNELNGHIKEHHNLFIRGKWLVPRGSGIRRGSITTQPGEVIEHNPGFEPKQADLKPLPGAVYGERQRIMEDYQLVSGVHRVSMGAPPPGVTAGVAFLQLQEADDTDLGPFLAMLEESVAELTQYVLQIVQARYDEERLVYVAGPGRQYQVRAFTGADLKGAIAVVPVVESSFPWSKTAKQSMMLTLAQQMPSLFENPETGAFDRAAFARMLPVGGLDQFAASEDIDVQEALNEEDLFAHANDYGGQYPEVAWWQNHEIHYNQHVRILKAGAHLKWGEEAQARFMEHVQQTMEARDQKRAQANIEAGGTPPGPQAPPGEGAPLDQLMEQQAQGEPGMEEMMVPDTGLAPEPAAGEQRKMMAALEGMRGGEDLEDPTGMMEPPI